jgi:hypothetical protein
MKTEEFDKIFDDNEGDITSYLDMDSVCRPNRESVTIDFPIWMLESIDKESVRLGVNRQSLIKHWLAEKLPQNMAV